MFVCTCIICFQSLMDLEPQWHVDVYQQNVIRMSRNKAENHILNQNLFSLVSMRIQKNSNFSVSRPEFDSRCNPGVFSSWTEFDFCFATENSGSFKTVIGSTNFSSHCLSRGAEHIRLTAFRWRCDEVEMRGTCLEAQKSRKIKVVINSWKLHYDVEDTFKKNRLEEFFDIRRNGKFYYGHSVKKCTKCPFDSRAHLKAVRRLWFPTSDRLKTWLILSGTIRSKQYHESTMVWRNLPSYHL